MESKEKFTEKYKKYIPFFIDKLNLPEWITVELVEETPYRVIVVFHVDYVRRIRDANLFHAEQTVRALREYFKNYLGVNLKKSITLGGLDLDWEIKNEGVEEWVKNVLDKKIKKDIKKMPFGKFIHSFRFVPYDSATSDLTVVFNQTHRYDREYPKHKIIAEIHEYLKGLGYEQILPTYN